MLFHLKTNIFTQFRDENFYLKLKLQQNDALLVQVILFVELRSPELMSYLFISQIYEK